MDNNNQKQNQNKNNGKWPILIMILGAVLIMMFAGSRMWDGISGQFSSELTYDDFISYIESGKAEEVTLYNGSQWNLKLKDDRKTYYTTYLPDEDIVPLLKEKGVKFSAEVSSSILSYLLIYILPIILMVGFFFLLTRKMGGGAGGGIFSVGKSTAKKLDIKKSIL